MKTITTYLIAFISAILGWQTGFAQELVKDVWAGSPSGLDMLPPELTEFNNMLFFAASDGISEREVWKSDGTTAGTVLLKDISAGDALPSNFTVVNDLLFFTAISEPYGNELWKTDGTEAGTLLVKDFTPDGYSAFHNLIAFNDSLFVVQENGEPGADRILYKTNGTEAGTVMVRDENGDFVKIATYYDFFGTNILVVGNILYFLGATDSYGTELWAYDGSVARMVKDITPGAGGTTIYDLTNVNGTLFFATPDGLWKSDGTTAGTVLVSPVVPAPTTNFNMAGVGNTLFFVEGETGASDRELWKSDGTAAGTELVKNINPVGNSDPYQFTNVNGVLYFTAHHPDYGMEVWRSDGTSAGTELVTDLNPGVASSGPFSLTNIQGHLYYTATNGTSGWELWRVTGTSTDLLFEIIPGPLSGRPTDLIEIDGTLYFTARTADAGKELWKYTLPTTPPASLAIPDALRNYRRYAQLIYARERDWCWTDIFIDWEIIPSCGDNSIPCPEEFFTLSLENLQEEMVWQESFLQPIKLEIPLPDKQPFMLKVSEGKSKQQEIMSLDPLLVPLGVTEVQMEVFPQEGYFNLQIEMAENEQLQMVLALVDEEGKELWTTEFTAPFEGKFDDQIEGRGVKFALKPADDPSAKAFDLQMLVIGSDKIIPVTDGNELDAAALNMKLYRMQLGKTPENIKAAEFRLYRNGYLISVRKDYHPKFATYIVPVLDGEYWLETKLFAVDFPRLEEVYVFDVNFSIKNSSWGWPFIRKELFFKFWPNPVIDRATISFMPQENSIISLTILSYQGAVVLEKTFYLGKGRQEVELDLKQLKPGLYKCIIKDSDLQHAKVISFIKR